jgi:hypothetical protein
VPSRRKRAEPLATIESQSGKYTPDSESILLTADTTPG